MPWDCHHEWSLGIQFGVTQPCLISFPHGQRQHLLVHQKLKRSAGRHRRRPTAGTENWGMEEVEENQHLISAGLHLEVPWKSWWLGFIPNTQKNNQKTEMIKLDHNPMKIATSDGPFFPSHLVQNTSAASGTSGASSQRLSKWTTAQMNKCWSTDLSISSRLIFVYFHCFLKRGTRSLPMLNADRAHKCLYPPASVQLLSPCSSHGTGHRADVAPSHVRCACHPVPPATATLCLRGVLSAGRNCATPP